MSSNVLAVLGSILVFAITGSASAQCQAASHHWTFSALGSSSDSVSLGMRNVGKYWVPAICKDNLVYNTTSLYRYTSNLLEADASICTGAGHDNVDVIASGATKACGKVTLKGFFDNGYELYISMEAGNDGASAYYYNGDTRIWGGDGNDVSYGGPGSDFLSCGAGDDFAMSNAGSDDMRGGAGKDWLMHSYIVGHDYIRGEDGDDCIESYVETVAGSSCDAGADKYQRYSDQLASCEAPVEDCLDYAGP